MQKSTKVLIIFIFSFVITGFAWYHPTFPILANNPSSSVHDGMSPPGPIINPSPIPCVGGETVLLIQDNVPWFAPLNQDSLGANVTELKAQNKTFCIINSSQVGTTNLSQFSEIVLSAAQVQSFYDNLFPGGTTHSVLSSYVQNGGILSANLTDNASGPGAGGNWDGRVFIGGLTHTTNFTENNNISSPSHSIIIGQFGGTNGGQITDTANFQDLDGWNSASHGFFTNLPPNTITVLSDSLNRPVLIEYPFGTGRVIASQVTNEWRYAGDFGSLPQNKKLLANEIGYQNSLICTPIDPNTLANMPLTLADGSMTALKDSPLAGLENVFIEKGCKHHVDPRLLVAIAAHESLLGLGAIGARHVNPVGQTLPADDGVFDDGLDRTWQWKSGTKFCGKFDPFGLLLPVKEQDILDCVSPQDIIGFGRPAFKFDSFNVAINYLAQLLSADWLYFTGNAKCVGLKITVSGIADNQSGFCGYTGVGEEIDWANGVTEFLQTLMGNPSDVRNPAGFIQPRPTRDQTSDDYILISDPLDILITDPQGRRIGFDAASQQVINEITGATFSGRNTNPTQISIPAPLNGEYNVSLSGINSSPYLLRLFSQNATGTFPRIAVSGDVGDGEKIDIQFQHDFERGSSLPLILDVKPKILNTSSKGEFTALLTIPKNLDIQIKDISISAIRLEDIIPIKVRIANNKQLVAHFKRGDFSDVFIGNELTILKLTGALSDGTSISAQDSVKLLKKSVSVSTSSLLANLQTVLTQLLQLLGSL